jgi:hypothetical protein
MGFAELFHAQSHMSYASKYRRGRAHCRHNGGQQHFFSGETLAQFTPRKHIEKDQLHLCAHPAGKRI